MDYLREHPNANRSEITSAIDSITDNGVKYNLKVLQQKGYLRRNGPDKGGHWEVIEEQ